MVGLVSLYIVSFIVVASAKFEPGKGLYNPQVGSGALPAKRPPHEILYNGSDVIADEGSMGRAAFQQNIQLWPKDSSGSYIVPFEIDGYAGFSASEVELLYWAMESIMRGSNLVFRERVSEVTYVLIQYDPSRCASTVGYGVGVRQILLEHGCFYPGTLQHELLHTLGFHHEQVRPDRDQHLVMTGSDSLNNAIRHDVDVALTPYDLSSIMQYSGLKTKDSSMQQLVDIRKVALSSCDWNALNTKYPGKKPAPKCEPNKSVDYCEPNPTCSGNMCDFTCREYCEISFHSCQFEGGSRFPHDAMWQLGFTDVDVKPSGNHICEKAKAAEKALRSTGCDFKESCKGGKLSAACEAATSALKKLQRTDCGIAAVC